MAQMKSKRKTKHRGNAAGVIESRGRTGRPPSPQERKRQTREARLRKEPTWRGSAQRAVLAAVIMFAFLSVTDHPKHGSRFVAAAVLYTPGGYYFERYLYRRRMANPKR